MKSASFSWCPSCKYWVPSKYMKSWTTEEEQLDEERLPWPVQIGRVVRMCENCLESTPGNLAPIFSVEGLIRDEHYENFQCPFCNSYNTVPYCDPKLSKGDFWICRDCGELVYGGMDCW